MGQAPADVYRQALDRAFQSLRANPELGRVRDDLAADIRGFVVREHTILYRIEDDTIRVLRILHVRMDAAKHLDE